MSKFTKAALELKRQGYSVIPCKSGTKESLVPWKQYQKRRPTEKKIKEWGVKFPDANVGVVTGEVSGIIVLDLDGPEAEWEVEKRGGVPKTPCSKTRKGYHYVFRYPGFPVRSGSDKELSIDIRADGGYIIAPPSIHPSGHEYAWIVSPFDVEPAPMPNWLVKYIKQRSSQSGDDEDLEGQEKGQIKTEKEVWKRTKKIIRQYPKITKWLKTPKPKDRSGHDWRLVRLCLEHGVNDDDLLYQILLNNKYGKATEHPRTDKYIKDCIRKAKDLQECEEVLIPASELMKMDFDEDHELIGEGILNTSTSLILGGESGTWKTTLAMEWTLRLVSGKPIVGLPVQKVDGVVILQTENTLAEMQHRLGKIASGLGLKKPTSVSFSREGQHFDLNNEEHIAKIIKLIKTTGAELLILDPLISFHHRNENDNVEMRLVLDQVTKILRATGAAGIIIHHYGKPGERRARHRLRGASAIVDWADTVIGISTSGKADSGRLRVQFQKIRYGPPRDDLLLERDQNFIHNVASKSSPCPPQKIVEILRDDFNGICKRKGDLEKSLAKKLGFSTRSAAKYVDAAEKAGAIKLSQDGNTKKVEVVE